VWVAVFGICTYSLIGGITAIDHKVVASSFTSRRAILVVAWSLVIITGILLFKRKPLAYTLAPSFIVFLILTDIPILLTPVIQAARGETATWGVVVPIGTLTAVLLALLVWLLSTIRPQEKTA
jgi:hypothetical protein